jgi:hypothetical protein
MALYETLPVEKEAYVIEHVMRNESDGTFIVGLDNGEKVHLAKEKTARMTPVEGDYLVRDRADDPPYEYLNPKAVFERKHKLIS